MPEISDEIIDEELYTDSPVEISNLDRKSDMERKVNDAIVDIYYSVEQVINRNIQSLDIIII